MDIFFQHEWHPRLLDPTAARTGKPRNSGKTMVIDKGLGLHAFKDLLETSAEYIDVIKIGFGTAPLYPKNLLKNKISMAKEYDICVMPGGTFLEIAVSQDAVPSFFKMLKALGFNGVEVSDGTIEMGRKQRNELILRGVQDGFTVFTEYGKKLRGSTIDVEELVNTIHIDMEFGAALVIIEGRESGKGVGLYDEQGDFLDEPMRQLLQAIPNRSAVMWEAPLREQQARLIVTLGNDIHLGNIAPADILSLESLRRGLRSDTFNLSCRNSFISLT